MPPTTILLAVFFAAQTPVSGSSFSPTPSAATAVATRAQRAPVIDGRDDDEVWREAQPITAFREFEPVEDGEPRFPTEAKVAYDDRNIYVFVRAFDPHPDSLLRLLSRRDVRTASDQIKIIIDSYHDRRTGFEFAVNPAGVKRDYAIYNDRDEDDAWDGVWEAATRIDSLGWAAEFRIPLSQLRYADAPTHAFGFGIWRDIERFKERVSWPVYRETKAGLSSQLGEVDGIADIRSPRRLEVTPYTVTKNVSVPTGQGFDRAQDVSAGADIKYGLTSNLTVDATANPDFGQVEADPAVLNLTAFETFFQEKRPFFIEGTGILRMDVNCTIVNCNGEGLFYSRRIGRQPQLTDLYGDARSPTATTILGAAKLTGRLQNGLSVGLLDGVTQRASGTADRTIEPRTNYAVARVQQDLRRGETGVGVIATVVNRSLDQWSADLLRRSAYVGGLDVRHRFLKSRYELSGSLNVSRVAGSAAAVAATERSSVHYYQRPDGGLTYDSTRTSLAGDAEAVKFGKVGGGITRFETSYQRLSPGFEINDLGFLLRGDQQSWSTWAGLQFTHPGAFYQRGFGNFNEWQYWTAAGLLTERAVNSNWHIELKNHWWVHGGGTLGQLTGAFCDRCARGGPAVRQSPQLFLWGGTQGDERRGVVPGLWMNYARGDDGRSHFVEANPSLDLRVATRFSLSLGVDATGNHNDVQWYGNFTDSTGLTHYTFAHLYQQTVGLTWRVNYTATPNVSLQIYAQPFVSRGAYSDVRELADPRASDYASRYKPYGDPAVTSAPGGFNFKQFRSNTVLRWEYRPGSTLFVVWTQGRRQFDPAFGTRSFSGDFGDLFGAHPDNTFLVKASYWFNW